MRKAFSFWLASLSGLSSKQKHQLVRMAGSAEAAFGMSETDIRRVLSEEKARYYVSETRRTNEKLVAEQYTVAAERGIRFCSAEDAVFPEILRAIPDCPYGLFFKGSFPRGILSVGVVGARKSSHYGKSIAERIGKLAAGHGCTIVSGMARGIDSAAQESVLRNGGSTIAVLGCGPDICYPAEMKRLYSEICEVGAVVSEYPPGTHPFPAFFPARNRIISGLSDVLAVVEAGRKSGSLITADFALEQGKDIYAVPGRLDDPLSLGCNDLIRQGAGIITSCSDFFRELGFLSDTVGQSSQNNFRLAKGEDLLYSVLCLHPKSLFDLQKELGSDAEQLLRTLTALELKGLARQVSPGQYVRAE